jgi:hypothetical protein
MLQRVENGNLPVATTLNWCDPHAFAALQRHALAGDIGTCRNEYDGEDC